MSVVRENLMRDPEYRPYVGCNHMNRARFNGKQFDCHCGWHTTYEASFITGWLEKHQRAEGFQDPREWHRHGVKSHSVLMGQALSSIRKPSAMDELIARVATATSVK